MAANTGAFAFAADRLMVNWREYRYVQEVGTFAIGPIARAANVGVLTVDRRLVGPGEMAGMHDRVIPFDDRTYEARFAPCMLDPPLLACLFPDGKLRLLDGRKRARQAFARGGACQVRVAVVLFDDVARLGLVDDTKLPWQIAEATKYHPIGRNGEVDLSAPPERHLSFRRARSATSSC